MSVDVYIQVPLNIFTLALTTLLLNSFYIFEGDIQ